MVMIRPGNLTITSAASPVVASKWRKRERSGVTPTRQKTTKASGDGEGDDGNDADECGYLEFAEGLVEGAE